jgi:hypothetical protein
MQYTSLLCFLLGPNVVRGHGTNSTERDTLTQARYTWKFVGARLVTPVKAISIKFALVVASAPAVSLT